MTNRHSTPLIVIPAKASIIVITGLDPVISSSRGRWPGLPPAMTGQG
jgi:hypothetical protein